MTTSLSVVLISILVILSATRGILAVDSNIVLGNWPDGQKRFLEDIGFQNALNIMSQSSEFILKAFHEDLPPFAGRKPVTLVTLYIDESNKVKNYLAFADGSDIHFRKSYIDNYKGDVKREFTGIMYSVMTQVWQWKGNGQAPMGLLTGIGDFMRLKAGYAPVSWQRRGQGKKWDEGYEITAYFLDYCNGLNGNFISELNKKMKDGYSDKYFNQLLKKPVDQLWNDYKAKNRRP